jgi:hypothetical protein
MTTNNPILGDDPDNDLAILLPVISFLTWSRTHRGMESVPFSDITCNFGVKFALITYSQLSNNPTPPTPIPINGDCNAKFREMYKKKTGKDDETLSETCYLICPDTDKLPLAGEGKKCLGSETCKYYSFTIENDPTTPCETLYPASITVVINYINPKLTVDDFDNPWSYEIIQEWTNFSDKIYQINKIGHYYIALETNARAFGLTEGTTVEKILTAVPWIETKEYKEYIIYKDNLVIEFVRQNIHKSVSRSYITFLDAAGNVGG